MMRTLVHGHRGIAALTIVLGTGLPLLWTADLGRRERAMDSGHPAEVFSAIDEAQAGAIRGAQRQRLAEEAVVVFQIVGLCTLGASWLSTGGDQANRRSAVLLGSQVALGLAGSLCASFHSSFALFAGATVVVLFLGEIMNERAPGAEGCARPRPRRIRRHDPRPRASARDHAHRLEVATLS